jgi:hypothetical protein
MFRAQSNIFDDVVVKATDENLTSENWEYILVRTLLATPWAASWTDVAINVQPTTMPLLKPTAVHLTNSLHRMYATRSDRPTPAPKMRLLP